MHANRLGVAVGLVWVFAFASAEAKGRPHPKRHTERKIELPPPPAKSPVKSEEASNEGGGEPVQHKGPTRIDFDDRLIQGQTNKAGAVYLYDRKELEVRSMVKLRESFRQEIYQDAYGAR